MCRDALHREESCGGHFREEHQTPDGEALRDDDHFAYVAAWEYTGGEPVLHREDARPSSTCARRSGATHEADAAACGARRGRRRAGDFETYEVDGRDRRRCRSWSCSISSTSSWSREGSEPVAFESRLPRGHLRRVRADDRRPGARPAARHRDLPAAPAALQRRRRRSSVEPFRSRRLPDRQGPRRRPLRVRPHHRGGRLHHRADRLRAGREPDRRSPRRTPTARWTPPRASAAAPAWPPAPTAPASSSPRPSSRT